MSVLYTLDADYSALTEAEEAELAPQVDIPAGSLTQGTILRGRLTGKMSTPEVPGSARIRAILGPPLWGEHRSCAVGDLVMHGTSQYRCTAAGTTETKGFPYQKRNLVAFWPLHEKSGVAYDHSDNATNLTDIAYGTGYRPSERGYCLHFDGKTGYANGLISHLGADWSYFLWVKPDSLPASGETNVLIRKDTSTKCLGLDLLCPAGIPTLRARWYDQASAAEVDLDYATRIEPGAWSFVAVTHSGINTKMYINNVLVAEDTDSDSRSEVAAGIYLGRAVTAVYHFHGSIQGVGFYNRGLSAEEIEHWYRRPPQDTSLNNTGELGPSGSGAAITDGTVTWAYQRESAVLLDTGDMAFLSGELPILNAPWMLEFEIHTRPARRTGIAYDQWPTTFVANGRFIAGNGVAPLLLPIEGGYEVVAHPEEANVLHILYEPELDTSSITCMTYVLEAL